MTNHVRRIASARRTVTRGLDTLRAADTGRPRAQFLAAVAGSDTAEVLFTAAVQRPAPQWTPGPNRRVWRTPQHAPLPTWAQPRLPAEIGATDRGTLILDLAVIRILHVCGPPSERRQALRHLRARIAVSARRPRLIELSRASPPDGAPLETGITTDGNRPAVIVGELDDPTDIERVVAAVRRTPSLSAILAGAARPAGAWRLDCSAGSARIHPMGIEVQLPSRVSSPQPAASHSAGQAQRAAGNGEVEIRVLGAVEITGARHTRRKALELAVFLALHPRGASDDKIITALWPDGAPSRRTFNNTIGRARAALGSDPNGVPYLAKPAGRTYRANTNLITDLDRFEALAAIDGADDAETRRALGDALALVRGQPFEAPDGYEWAYTEGLAARAGKLIGDTADQLAAAALTADMPLLAGWAARQGLLGAPGDERLYRHLLAASAAVQDWAGVETIWDELAILADGDDPLDALDPETIDAYRQVSRAHRVTK